MFPHQLEHRTLVPTAVWYNRPMKRGRRNLHLDYRALYERYLAGESGVSIARELGIDHTGLYMSWKRRGWPMRSASEAARMPFDRDPSRGKWITQAMQAARRGNTDPMWRKEQRARTREAKMLGTSPLEDALATQFDALGLTYIRQKAIGPYNADFAFPTEHLVVEVDGGGHNPRVRANHAARTAYLVSEGWRVVELNRRWLAEHLDDRDEISNALGML